MMKNIFPPMLVITIFIIIAMSFSLLLMDFPDMISFLIFVGKIVGIWSACYCIGYGGAWGVSTTMDKIKDRHHKRFEWYCSMGLMESITLIEPKYCSKYSKHYWMRVFK